MHQESLPITRAEFESLAIFNQVAFESLAGYLLGREVIQAKPGDILISPDIKVRRLLILLEGVLEVHLESAEGLLVRTIEAGGCVGEMSVFDNTDPSAWVVARDPSRILEIGAYTAIAMLNASHDLCLNMLHVLSQRVRYNSSVMTADKHHIRRIEEHASVDSLTGLHNRRWMETMYPREIQRCNSGNVAMCALMLDVDHFKNVNDTYGHLAGDQVLVSIAKSLTDSLRPTDMLVRYGGEEFAILLPGTSVENSLRVSDRIRRAVEKTPVKIGSSSDIQITISIGLAIRVPDDSMEDILSRADRALYAAKESGRNRICIEGE